MDNSLSQYEKRVFDDPFFGQAMQLCWAQNAPFDHKVVVEVGCGSGEASVLFALHGASVIGVDIDQQVINNSVALAEKWGVADTCSFVAGRTEALPIADQTADIVFSRSTMQYLDRTLAIPECLRVLKPGGTLVLIENLPFNPFMRLYRLVRRLKATSEKDVTYLKSLKGYLTQTEFDALSTHFRTTVRQNYHLFRMFPMLLGVKIDGRGGAGRLVRQVDVAVARLDQFLLTNVPSLKQSAWFTCYIGKHKK